MIDITQQGEYNGAFKAGSPDDDCFETEMKFYDYGFVEKFDITINTDSLDLDEAGGVDIH